MPDAGAETVGPPTGAPAGAAVEAMRLRHIVEAGNAGAADWQAYGDALAALGYIDRATRARHRARTLAGDRPVPSPPPPAAPPRIDPDGVKLFLSSRQAPPDERDRAGMARSIGTSDYSYGFAMRNFLDGIVRIGVPWAVIRHPEFVADIRDRSPAACNIHLGFYPPEQIRLLKGAYNVDCFAWEFDRLRAPAEVPGPHAFADQVTMLDRVDELWVPSAHGAAAVARSVQVPVRTVPAPVFASVRDERRASPPTPGRLAALAEALAAISWQPLAIMPRAQAEMNHTADQHRHRLDRIIAEIGRQAAPALFVTVLNVHDYRKQIRPMLQGFAEFSQTHRNAVLLVKSSTPNRGLQPINSFLLAEQIFDVGERSRPLVSDRVWITDDVLTREEMNHLYDAAAYYICTSHAEGQNLPLLEAMGRGVVPVSVDHTAMADYIGPENAVPIRSTRRPFDLRLSRRYGMFGIETNFVATDDVRVALEAAIALDDTGYAALSAAAIATVQRLYGVDRLMTAMRALIATARTRLGHAAHG